MAPASPPLDHHGAWIRDRLRQSLAGRYAVEDVIGRGGMAVVYRATDLRHSRQVAIKVLQPDLASSIAASRFLVEIQVAAHLVHPHIVGLIDSGEADGLPYYIMPHIAGETLRDRLLRERRLPVPEAGRLALEVASALAYAHLHGVIHRDVKPENVLLVDGAHAMVADFGLALALFRSSDVRQTPSHHIVGTLAYMAPEQASADEVDGRADVYSLGCMLFEMLAGRPPFEGDTMALLAQHLSAPPPRLSTPECRVPLSVESVVQRALAKEPARRHATADEFARELEGSLRSGRRRWPPLPPRPVLRPRAAAALGLIALAAGGSVALGPESWAHPIQEIAARFRSPPLDSTRIAIFPLRRGPGIPADDGAELLLHEAFARWQGITVVDQFAVGDAVSRARVGNLAPADARGLARRFRAGRYVQGGMVRLGRERRVQVALYDASSGHVATDTTIRLTDGGSAEEAYRRAADMLLFGGIPVERPGDDAGTSSYPALHAYLRGQAAIRDWQLAAADSAFAAAISLDGGFPAAQFWLAQVRSWRGQESLRWRGRVEAALALADRLPAREQVLARALRHLARREYPEACAAYRELRRTSPRDFAAAYGLGECIRQDDIIVPDARSPSRWRFRASRAEGMEAYRAAFALRPAVLRAYSENAFAPLRRILLTSTSARVDGHTPPPDTGSFRAAPSWDDSLVLVPYPRALEARAPELTVSVSAVEAVSQQQRLLREIAAAWRSASPDDLLPREAMAVGLALAGDSTALDTIRAARRLATTGEERVRLAAREVWLRLNYALPDDTIGLAAAVLLADSLLMARTGVPASAFEILSGIAALTGRARQAAMLAARVPLDPQRDTPVPPRTASTARALLAYAAVGGPVDSIRALEIRIVRDIDAMGRPERKGAALRSLLGQAPALAFPAIPLESHRELANAGDPVIGAQWALARGDRTRAARMLARRTPIRLTRRGADLSLDMTYAGAWTLAAAGDRREAITWLDHVLNAAALYSPEAVASAANAGALVRALLLRAELARASEDSVGAARWSRPAAILWRGADPELRALIRPGAPGTLRGRVPAPGLR